MIYRTKLEIYENQKKKKMVRDNKEKNQKNYKT